MKVFFSVVIFTLFSSVVSAQEKVADKKFLFTSYFLVGTTVFDVETTFACMNKSGVKCKEGNDLLGPLFNSGRPAVYTVEGAVDVGLITWSYKLKKSGNKLWWLPPLAFGAVHGLEGGFNLRFIF